MSAYDLIQEKFIVGRASKQGDARRKYEDRVFSGTITSAAGQELLVAIVADGVGSANGSIAANLAVDTIHEYLQTQREPNIAALITGAIKAANEAVWKRNQANQDSMSLTTVVMAIIFKQHLYVGNAGDSRAYLIRNGSLRQLTNDHTYFNMYGGDPHTSKAETVINCVGREPGIKVDIGFYPKGNQTNPQAAQAAGMSGMPLKEGDAILLCSDGLIKTHPVTGARYASDEEIVDTIQTEISENAAAVKIVSYAEGREVDDNVSVVTVQYLTPEMIAQTQAGKQKAEKIRKLKKYALIGGGLVGLILLVILAKFAIDRVQELEAISNLPTNTPIFITNTPAPTATPEVVLFDGQAQVFQINGADQVLYQEIPGGAFAKLNEGEAIQPGWILTTNSETGVRIAIGTAAGKNHIVYLFPGSEMEVTLDGGFNAGLIRGGVYVQPAVDRATVNFPGYPATYVTVDGSRMIAFVDNNAIHIECYEGLCTLYRDLDGAVIPVGTKRSYQRNTDTITAPVEIEYDDQWQRNQVCSLCLDALVPSPTPSPTATNTQVIIRSTKEPTATETLVPRRTSTPTPTTSNTPTPLPTATFTPSPTNTPTPTRTPTDAKEPPPPKRTDTPTVTPTYTDTPGTPPEDDGD